MYTARLITVLLAAMALPGLAQGADIRLSYLVNAKTLKKEVRAGSPLAFQLFTDASCSTPIASEVVNAEAVDLVDQLRPVKVKDGPVRRRSRRCVTS